MTTYLFVQDERILKGEEWHRSKPEKFSFAYSIFGKLKKADPEATALVRQLMVDFNNKVDFS